MIDASQAEETGRSISAFVRRYLDSSNRTGIAVALSGGLDSTVTAALCVRGVGPERVTGFFLPERQSPPEDRGDAWLAAEWLGIDLKTYDMTGALEEMGTYDFVLSRLPSDALRAAAVRVAYGLRRVVGRENPLEGGQGGSRSAVVYRSSAHFKSRHRMRMVFLYFRAERENLLVAGCANLTEKLTGIYTRFGVDDCADIMPIAGLYRTEVLRVAESLGVPERILNKTPAPGIIPGVRDKYVYLLDIDADRLDRILEDIDLGMSVAELAQRHHLNGAHLERVLSAMLAAREMREVPTEPEKEGGS